MFVNNKKIDVWEEIQLDELVDLGRIFFWRR